MADHVSRYWLAVGITAPPERRFRLDSLLQMLCLHPTIDDLAHDAGTISAYCEASIGSLPGQA
jgi:hypothetical protein